MPYLQRLSVPDFHRFIKGTRDKHACVIRIPLNCLNTEFVDIPARPAENKNIRVGVLQCFSKKHRRYTHKFCSGSIIFQTQNFYTVHYRTLKYYQMLKKLNSHCKS